MSAQRTAGAITAALTSSEEDVRRVDVQPPMGWRSPPPDRLAVRAGLRMAAPSLSDRDVDRLVDGRARITAHGVEVLTTSGWQPAASPWVRLALDGIPPPTDVEPATEQEIAAAISAPYRNVRR